MDIYDLLYHLGVTANYTGFFQTASALRLLDEIVRDGNAEFCEDAVSLAAENGRTDPDSIRQCYYMLSRREFRPEPLKFRTPTPALNYNPNLTAYDGLTGGVGHD